MRAAQLRLRERKDGRARYLRCLRHVAVAQAARRASAYVYIYADADRMRCAARERRYVCCCSAACCDIDLRRRAKRSALWFTPLYYAMPQHAPVNDVSAPARMRAYTGIIDAAFAAMITCFDY